MEEREQAASRPDPAERPPGTDVALVLSPRRISTQAVGLFGSRDWSAWWMNLLEQEVGPFSLLEAETLGLAELRDRRAVVVPASSWLAMSHDRRRALQEYLDRGGVVVAETAPAEAGRLSGPGLVELGLPATTELVRMQQGWHGEAMALRGSTEPFPGVPPGFIQPHALVPAGTPRIALEPLADRRERTMWARVEQHAPLPRWWYFPHAAAGVVVSSHDEEGFGDRSVWMSQHEAAAGVRSTVFAIAGAALTRDGAADLLATGSDVQLHWNRGFFGLQPERRLGLGPFQPLVRTLSLAEQQQALRALLPQGAEVELNRNHGLVWDPQWGRSFRILAAAGIVGDSSYGPTGPGRFGYLFGTGLPFRPLDDNGFPLPLHEIPFLFQDDEEFTPALQIELLERSLQGDHQLIMPIYHVNTMARAPSLDRLQGWLELSRRAHEHAHRVMDLGAFLRFWLDRARSPIRSSFRDGTLEVEVEARTVGLTLRVPELIGEERLFEVRVDGAVIPSAWIERRGDASLIALDQAGRHCIEVLYR